MIRSMTAFAKAKKIEDNLNINVEIRSYNSRHLDTKIRISHGFNSLEEKVKSLVSEKIARGRVELHISIVDESEASKAFDIDQAKAKAYYNALCTLKNDFRLKGEITLDNLLGINGIIIPKEVDEDAISQWKPVGKCIEDAIDQLNAMRQTEGNYLLSDFEKRLRFIEDTIETISGQSGNLMLQYRTRLEERIKSLTQGIVDIDTGRIEQESAILADKSDISEEIVRSRSHIKQFRTIMNSDEPGGRKLNFLLQEFNREFNTMGSKIGNADISHLIVDVKSELEKMREQIQNVE